MTSDEMNLISTWSSRSAKCPFVKQKWPFIETKSPFPRTTWLNYFILTNFLIFHFLVWNIFITYFAYMFYEMIYNDAYANHVNIGCENKKLNWDVIFLKNIFMLLKQNYGYLMLFINYLIAIKKLQTYYN